MDPLKKFFDETCLSDVIQKVINIVNEQILELSIQYSINPSDTEIEQELHTAREALDLVLLQKRRLDLKQQATDSHKEYLIAKNLRNQAKLDNDLETAKSYDKFANEYYATYQKYNNECGDLEREFVIAVKNFKFKTRSLDFFNSINLN
jgi:predicted CopG family antitoxin